MINSESLSMNYILIYINGQGHIDLLILTFQDDYDDYDSLLDQGSDYSLSLYLRRYNNKYIKWYTDLLVKRNIPLMRI